MQLTTEQATALLQLAQALDACKAEGITLYEFLGDLHVATMTQRLITCNTLDGAAVRRLHA